MRQPRSPHAAGARLAASLFVLMHLAAVAVYAQDAPAEQFGNVLFRSPAGWRRVEQGGALLLIPPDLPVGQSCALIVLPGEDLRGGFRVAFDAARAALQRGERVVSEGEVSAEHNAGGFDTLSALALTEDQGGKRTYRFYLAAHPSMRIEMFVFAATSDELLRRYVPAFKEFVGSVSFANLKSPAGTALAPHDGGRRTPQLVMAARAAGLDGLYVATESRQQFNVNTKFYDYVVRQLYYLFSPDGRVCRGLPKGGALDDFDFDRAAQDDPSNLGSYRIAGGVIQFSWPGGQPPPLAFSGGRDSLRIGNSNFLRVGTSEGRSLAGVYARGTFTNVSGGAGVAAGGVGGDHSIAFNRDGRFAQRGVIGFAGSNAGGGAAVSKGERASGAYRVSGNTLELRYDDGRSTRHTFFFYPREENVLVIDGITYLRRER